jgi:hypothetical protein
MLVLVRGGKKRILAGGIFFFGTGGVNSFDAGLGIRRF